MSNTFEFQESRELQSPSQKTPNETMWRLVGTESSAGKTACSRAPIKAVKWACVGVLMLSVVASLYIFTPYVSAYQAVVRFAIGLSAIAIIFESLRARQYAVAALFAAVVLLFNPVIPTFALAGNWVILFAGALPVWYGNPNTLRDKIAPADNGHFELALAANESENQ
jgi:hypothetical protein